MVWYPNEIDFCNSKFILPCLGYTEASNKEPLMVGINTVDDTALSTMIFSIFIKGPGKTTYPLSANAKVLSATPRFPLSAFCSNYDVNIPLSAPIMMLKCRIFVSMVLAGGEWRKVCWRERKVDTLIYPDPFL